MITCSKTYLDPKTNKFYKTGELFTRPTYAETLRRVARNGANEIYGGGETGRMFVKDLQEEGGIITNEDLLNYK